MALTALPTPPNKYTDNPQQFSDKALAWTNALATFQTEANALAVEVDADAVAAAGSASTATTKAGEAAASAATALAAPGTSATSTTSVVIGTGSKSLTIQTGKSIVVGMYLLIAYTTDPTKYIHGQVTSYTSGTGALVVDVTTVNGSGTYAAWTISISAPAISGGVPVGAVIPFIGGYFTNATNGGFTNVLGNDATAVNSLVNPFGFFVCDGAAPSIPGAPVFNVAGRYLPNITDSRFLMGGTSCGGVGGNNDVSHTHTLAHTHTTGSFTLTTTEMPAHTHSYHDSDGGDSGGSSAGGSQQGHWYNTGSQGGGSSHNHGSTGAASTANTGTSSVTENRPLFLTCFYLQRVF